MDGEQTMDAPKGHPRGTDYGRWTMDDGLPSIARLKGHRLGARLSSIVPYRPSSSIVHRPIVLSSYRESKELGSVEIKKTATLSARQLAILQLLANGMEGKQIARQLYLTVSTVSTHVRRAGHVLGSRNRTHTVAVALRRGLIV